MVPITAVISFYLFAVLASRPTADEYLLGPVLNGYYVDRPQVPLFEPSDSLLIRYLQGTRAIVNLGWDAYLNAFAFQMSSSTLTNFIGPVATMIQGVVFALIVIWASRRITKFLIIEAKSFHFVYGCLVSGLILALSVANFNTSRENFGLFTFLGIRFGIYLVHAVVLLAMVVHLLKLEKENFQKRTFKTLFLVFLFCGMVSLWYVLYLAIFVSVRCTYILISRRQFKFYFSVLGVVIASTFALNAGLSGSRGRTAAGSKSLFEILLSFSEDVLFNTQSRLFNTELWNTVFGLHSLIALLFGLFVVLVTNQIIRWNNTQIKQLMFCLIPAVILLPVVFSFQEYVTYEAWWHRTTPIVISFYAFFVTGIWIGQYCLPKIQRVQRSIAVLLCGVLVMVFSTPSFLDGIGEVRTFRTGWDQGNILGIGSPLENDADYNVINAFRLEPYIMKRWDVQSRMLRDITVDVVGFDDVGNELSNDSQKAFRFVVRTAPSPFDIEFQGELSYRIEILDKTGKGGEVAITDKNGTVNHLLPSGTGRLAVIDGVMTQPGELTISQNPTAESFLDLEIVQVELGFSESIRTRFKLDPNDLIRKK